MAIRPAIEPNRFPIRPQFRCRAENLSPGFFLAAAIEQLAAGDMEVAFASCTAGPIATNQKKRVAAPVVSELAQGR
jgi:hypothetical protein